MVFKDVIPASLRHSCGACARESKQQESRLVPAQAGNQKYQ